MLTLFYFIFLIIFFGLGFLGMMFQKKIDLKIVFLSPILTYSITAILGSLWLGFSIKLWYIIGIWLTLFMLSIFLILYKNILYIKLTKHEIYNGIFSILLVFSLIYFLNSFISSIQGDILTIRFASDLAAYIDSTNHLLKGLTLKNPLLDFSKLILKFTHRWGIPTNSAIFSFILGANSVSVLYYLTISLHVFGMFSLAFLYMKDDEKNKVLLGLLLTLNIGILYYAFEAFLPQVVSISLSSLIFISFFQFRKTENYQYLILSTIFSSALFATYSEMYIMTFCYLFGVLSLDILLHIKKKDKKIIKIDLIFIILFILSILLVPNIVKHIIIYIFNYHSNIGYPMPSWSLPSDIIGITNIFSNSDVYVSNKGPFVEETLKLLYPFVIRVLLSIWVMYEIFQFIKSKDLKDKTFFLTPIIGTISFLVLNVFSGLFLDKLTHNYFYNKSLTIFAPIISLMFFSQVIQYKNKLRVCLAIGLILLSTILFYLDSKKNKVQIKLETIDLIKTKVDLDAYFFLIDITGIRNGVSIPKMKNMDWLLYRAIDSSLGRGSDRFLMQSYKPDINDNNKSKEIIFLRRKDSFKDQTTLKFIPSSLILFETEDFIAIRSYKTATQLSEYNPSNINSRINSFILYENFNKK